MSIPTDDGDIPSRIVELADVVAPDGYRLVPAWRNELDGVTVRVIRDDGDLFIKFGPINGETSFAAEAERFAWAAPYVPVPEVVLVGSDDTDEWLVTKAIAGDTAVAPQWIQDPATAVRAVGTGLRRLHDTLPVADCPFTWDVPSRIANAAARGIEVPSELREAPPVDRLVVCHGDACAPNVLIGADGEASGYVDLGAMGVADRWADVAVAAMSTEWNWGPGWHDTLIEAYGLPVDPERIRYYQALWNAT